MFNIEIKRILAGLFLTSVIAAQGFAQSSGNLPLDESATMNATAKSREREIEARLELRGDTLRTKLFELMVRELDLQARIEELDFRLTPYGLHRALAFEGSTRSMDELETALRTRLESQKARVNKLLDYVTSSRARIEAEIAEVEGELERIRQRLSLP
jgi:hypothetical protein